VNLGLLAWVHVGRGRPLPLPGEITRGIHAIRIRHSDRRPSGCEVTFRIGRQSQLGLPSFDHERAAAQLRQGNRISVTARITVAPVQLFDGVIAERAFALGDEPGTSTLTIRCRDLSLLMDLHEEDQIFPNRSDAEIVEDILDGYQAQGVQKRVTRPSVESRRNADDTVPEQRATDLQHLRALAERNGFVFYLQPGAAPGQSVAVWGPEPRLGTPRAALAVDMGPFTNATNFRVTAREEVGVVITGTNRDATTGQPVPITTSPFSLDPPLASVPAVATSPELVRTRRLEETNQDAALAVARAQARANSVADGAVRATCSVDVARLGRVLLPWQTVEVRGAGEHDGAWYVEEVRHDLEPGRFEQAVTLRRGGSWALSPRVSAP